MMMDKKELILNMLRDFGKTIINMDSSEFNLFLGGRQYRCRGFLGYDMIEPGQMPSLEPCRYIELNISGCVRG